MSLPSRPADPLEWHPWYRDRTYLLDWLTTGRYNGRQQDVLVIPVPISVAYIKDDPSTLDLAFQQRLLTRRLVARPAPWTGRPFHYRWFVGVDDLGRQIAADSWISYEDGYGPGD